MVEIEVKVDMTYYKAVCPLAGLDHCLDSVQNEAERTATEEE
jgi:hypothetical protein